jgi:hypothetical protein
LTSITHPKPNPAPAPFTVSISTKQLSLLTDVLNDVAAETAKTAYRNFHIDRSTKKS